MTNNYLILLIQVILFQHNMLKIHHLFIICPILKFANINIYNYKFSFQFIYYFCLNDDYYLVEIPCFRFIIYDIQSDLRFLLTNYFIMYRLIEVLQHFHYPLKLINHLNGR